MTEPMRIRAQLKDGVVNVTVLVAHEMESGQRRDAAGKLVPAWFIQTLNVNHNGKLVMGAQLGPAVSKNPVFRFSFKGGKPGDKISVSWKDNKGETRTDEGVVS